MKFTGYIIKKTNELGFLPTGKLEIFISIMFNWIYPNHNKLDPTLDKEIGDI